MSKESITIEINKENAQYFRNYAIKAIQSFDFRITELQKELNEAIEERAKMQSILDLSEVSISNSTSITTSSNRPYTPVEGNVLGSSSLLQKVKYILSTVHPKMTVTEIVIAMSKRQGITDIEAKKKISGCYFRKFKNENGF